MKNGNIIKDNKMKIIRVIFLILIFHSFSVLPVFAHDSWIDFSDPGNALSEGQLTVKISNGHAFPESKIAIAERVINYFKVIKPDGKIISLKTYVQGNYRAAQIKPVKEGTYILMAGLKNPPRYFLKSVVSIKKCTKTDLKTGEDFENVPEKCLMNLRKGERVVLTVFFKGKPVQSPLSFSINGTKNFSTSTDRKGNYELSIRSNGKYLVTSSLKGKTCSLTFEIK